MVRPGLCNMEVLWLFILGVALALPNQGPPTPRTSCIKMTPEKEQQIDLIIEKLENFLSTLTVEHEHFDIRLIKLSIEQHTEDEGEKETVLQLAVNDCSWTDDELEEIDHHREKAKEHDKANQAKKEQELKAKKETEANEEQKKLKDKKQEGDRNTDAQQVKRLKQEEEDKTKESEGEIIKQEERGCLKESEEEKTEQEEGSKSKPNFKVMYLDLDENGQKIVEALDKTRPGPRILFVQKDRGQLDYLFFNRR